MSEPRPAPQVSVVIPVHDNAATLEAQLRGIAAGLAAAPPTEILVVDNRSSDGSADLASRWADRAGVDLRIVDASERSGEPYARNEGVKASRGDVILFCDGDDVVSPTWVSSMARALRSASYATGPIDMHTLNPPWLANVRGRSVSEGMSLLYGTVPYAHGCNMGFRRAELQNLGGFDESLLAGCDLDIAVRAWRAGMELKFESGATISYRLRPTLSETFRQGRTYGRYGMVIRSRLGDLVDDRHERRANWKRRLWLIRKLPAAAVSKETRARWVWVLARQVGELSGARRAIRT